MPDWECMYCPDLKCPPAMHMIDRVSGHSIAWWMLQPCFVCAAAEYEKYKERADEANARKEQLHEEAKRMGDMGDRGADSKLHQLEQRLEVGGCRLPSVVC